MRESAGEGALAYGTALLQIQLGLETDCDLEYWPLPDLPQLRLAFMLNTREKELIATLDNVIQLTHSHTNYIKCPVFSQFPVLEWQIQKNLSRKYFGKLKGATKDCTGQQYIGAANLVGVFIIAALLFVIAAAVFAVERYFPKKKATRVAFRPGDSKVERKTLEGHGGKKKTSASSPQVLSRAQLLDGGIRQLRDALDADDIAHGVRRRLSFSSEVN